MATRKKKLTKKKRSVTHPEKLVLDAKKLQRILTQNRIRATLTGTRTFDRTLHKTNVWLKEIMVAMDWDNRERAYSMLRAVFHALRDSLPQNEMIQLGAQLPTLLRGVYYEGWKPKWEPLRVKTQDEFYDLVRLQLKAGVAKISDEQLQRVVHVIMQTMTEHIGQGEMMDIKGALKKRLRKIVPVSMDGGLYA